MSSPTCEICGAAVETKSAKLCNACLEKSGLQTKGAPDRPAAPCLRCGGLTFVRVEMRERTAIVGGKSNAEHTVPMAVTWAQGQEYAGVFTMKTIPSATADTSAPFGRLYTFVCRTCGFVEWYAANPAEIPIGAAHGTTLVEASSDRPYR
jgi:hypothetical protein